VRGDTCILGLLWFLQTLPDKITRRRSAYPHWDTPRTWTRDEFNRAVFRTILNNTSYHPYRPASMASIKCLHTISVVVFKFW
jgi:hypothetical protein